MPSPFPGMDPYIEGQGWWGFCTQYVAQIQRALAPLVRPRFVVYIEEHVYLTERADDSPLRLRPDVSIAERGTGVTARASASRSGTALLEPPVTLRLPQPDVERQVFLTIRRRDTGRLVCVIELLSPINKESGPGRLEYLAKRTGVIQSPAHLVELDFLRGGLRLPTEPTLPSAAYYVLISRADQRPECGVWPVNLRDRLPVIPIPLSEDAAPIALDLQSAFDTVYDAAAFADMLDYEHGTEPVLSAGDAAWASGLLAAGGRADAG